MTDDDDDGENNDDQSMKSNSHIPSRVSKIGDLQTVNPIPQESSDEDIRFARKDVEGTRQ